MCLQQTMACKEPLPSRLWQCMQTRNYSFQIVNICYTSTVLDHKPLDETPLQTTPHPDLKASVIKVLTVDGFSRLVEL